MSQPVRDGVCPVCGSDETLNAGRVPPHAALVMTAAGTRRSEKPCDGAGQPPEWRPPAPAHTLSPVEAQNRRARNAERRRQRHVARVLAHRQEVG